MDTVEHNNSTAGPPVWEHRASAIVTLGDLISFVSASESIPAPQKRYVRSAVNRATVLLGNGGVDVRADPKDVLRRLDRLSPAMAGMSPQSWANLKSRVRSALRYAAPYLASARSSTKLSGEWAGLDARLHVRERRQLSRFLRFAQGMGWGPGEIEEEHVDRFEEYLEHEAMRSDFRKVVRATRRAWNRAADSIPGRPHRRLAQPEPGQSPYWLRLEQLPSSLQQEIQGYLHRLARPDPFLGPGGKTLASTTVGQFRVLFITLASALVASGTAVDELTSIGCLVRPDNFEQALRFLYERAGDRVNHVIYRAAYRARRIAAHTGLPEEDLARLDDILASVKREFPAKPGLTPKNRRLLEHLDDPAFVNRLLAFPQRLIEAAKAASCQRYGASRARDAVAVELLLTCSMRVGNLAALRVGETIRKFGEGRDARWIVDLPAEAVKNRQPLRYVLLPESGRLIEWYLANWHPYWCGADVPWLFPANGGGRVDPRLLTIMIKKRARNHVGVEISCHQFRHLAAEIYLQADPTGLGVVSQHLGHRKFETTRAYYAREQTRIATERYHQVLATKRTQVLSRPRRRRRRTGSAP